MYFDFIIIGSGLAGLNFALNAAKKGCVLIITKSKIYEGSTWLAQGGIAAVFGPSDNFKKHILDTMKAGCFHNDRKAVEYIIKKAPAAIKKLQKLGVRFDPGKKGLPALNLEGGHSENRIVHCEDHTGQSIEEALVKRVKANKKIMVMENVLAKDLIVRSGRCYGVQILVKKRIHNIFGGNIIMACGGLGQVYERTTNPEIATGDGIAIAYRAGCKMKDLEFIQFHPTALKNGKKPYFLISETLRGSGAKLLNSKGQRFMVKIHPLAELAPRDIVSRAVFGEEKRGPVFLDARSIGEKEFILKFPTIYNKLCAAGIDPQKETIPITPVAHYSCGGIATNLKGQTNIKHLYAFGETACTGLHGANRLASNSLLEALVLTEQVPPLPVEKTVHIMNFNTPVFKKQNSSAQIRKKSRRIMWQKTGIIRKHEDLKLALQQLAALQKKLPPPTDRESTITTNILTTAILITSSALKRKKSLGCHFILTKTALTRQP